MGIKEKPAASEGDTKTSPIIDIQAYIAKYDVENGLTREVLHEFPTLCYLLGTTTTTPQTTDSRPDGVTRNIFFLTEGSGMFGLTHPDDAMRWRGIFNHVLGTTRQVYYLTQRMMELDEDEKAAFGNHGFDTATFDEIDPDLMRRFFLVSHAGRRRSDEKAWHGLNDDIHDQLDAGDASLGILKAEDAGDAIIELMRIEAHSDLLSRTTALGQFPNIVDNVLTYSDWTYGQTPQSLQARFEGLRKNQRQPKETLDVFEKAANHFEQSLVEILGSDVSTKMANEPYSWEERIRRAYCAPSGITMPKAFPDYCARFGIAA